MSKRDLRTCLADHPRLIGVLFTLLVSLSAAQPVGAGVIIHPGP